jgi:hypothetical protein
LLVQLPDSVNINNCLLKANLRESDQLESPDINGRIILRWLFRKWDVGVWAGTRWFRIRRGVGQL